MALFVIATPIGTPGDISQRAVEIIQQCDAIIGEEHKNASRLLKACQAGAKDIFILNEHSRPGDLKELCDLASMKNVALVTDCGTPGFCDPGADLVRLCREKNIEIKSVPGPSSLMAFLSICGHRLDQFLFRGFLPAQTEQRRQALKELIPCKFGVILMDTPYRLKTLLGDVGEILPKRKLVLGLELSKPEEQIIRGTGEALLKKLTIEKAEFMLLILPDGLESSR